jgi:tetratricopeptide (TPR) repeat protein
MSIDASPGKKFHELDSAIDLYRSEKFSEALSLLESALRMGNSDKRVLNLAASCFLQMNRPYEAETLWRRIVDDYGDDSDALNNLGVVLHELGRLSEAEAYFNRTLNVSPGHVGALINYGRLLVQLLRNDEAERMYLQAVKLQPLAVEAHENLGVLYRKARRLKEAEYAFRRVLDIKTTDAEAHLSLGVVLKWQRRLSEAEASYRHALTLNPGYFEVKLNLAHLLLTLGQMSEGWLMFESRYDANWSNRVVSLPTLGFPVWQGEPLVGKSLLVWPEQGYGDSLQFCRYLPLLKERGVEKLTIACPRPLASLFATIAGVDACIVIDEMCSISQHDYVCLLMSLPHRFRTTLATIPASPPYLSVPPERLAKWKDRIPHGRFKVGLVWAGDPRVDRPELNAVDRERSLSAVSLLPLLELDGITFVSLQKGENTRPQLDSLATDLRPFDPMEDVDDFADTAAIIDQLDLVISVDTSVVHLAGALNKPVWMLSRYDGCWRWLHHRDDSPWYPKLRLFRQTAPGDWDDVIQRVTMALSQLSKS